MSKYIIGVAPDGGTPIAYVGPFADSIIADEAMEAVFHGFDGRFDWEEIGRIELFEQVDDLVKTIGVEMRPPQGWELVSADMAGAMIEAHHALGQQRYDALVAHLVPLAEKDNQGSFTKSAMIKLTEVLNAVTALVSVKPGEAI